MDLTSEPLSHPHVSYTLTGNIYTKSVRDIEGVMEALRSGPYGRCDECDNDVMSHQVIYILKV